MRQRTKNAIIDAAIIVGLMAAGVLVLLGVIEFMWACADAGIPM